MTKLSCSLLTLGALAASILAGCGSGDTGGSGGGSTSSATTSSTTTSGSSSSSGAGGNAGAPYVFVHGAWMGAWAWDDVATSLKGKGATVTTVELPAHGDDMTPVSGATLDAYVAKVGAAVDAAGKPVILVGHSMAGMVVSVVADQKADKIAKLVYLAAFVPKEGDTLQGLSMMDMGSQIGPVLQVDPMKGTAAIPMANLSDIFCADCSAAALMKLTSKYRDEPIAPFGAPAHVSMGGWAKVNKYYIYTMQDHAVSYAFQQTMTKGVTLAGMTTLDTSHSPFLSNPNAVVQALTAF